MFKTREAGIQGDIEIMDEGKLFYMSKQDFKR
jgi:hypothetical protein